MADKNLRIKVEAEADEFTKAMLRAKESGVSSLKAIMDANKQSSVAVKEHNDRVLDLEAAFKRSLTPSQRTALVLAEVKKARVEDAAAIDLQKKAIAGLEAKLEDQLKREQANKGRSLSMLFDELRTSLELIPGPAGTVVGILNSVKDRLDRIGDAAEATKKAHDGLQELSGAAAEAGVNGQRGSASIGAMAGMAGVLAVGVTAAAATLGIFAVNSANTTNEIALLARQAGMSAEEFSRLRLVARVLDTDLGEFTQGFIQLAGVMADATQPGTVQANLFKALNVEVKGANGQLRDALAVTLDAADAISRMTSSTEQADAAQRLFGEDTGRRLLPLLRQGRQAFLDLMDANDKMGLSLSTRAVKDAEEYRQSVIRLESALSALSEAAGRIAVPAITAVSNILTESLTGWRALPILVTEGRDAAREYVQAAEQQASVQAELSKQTATYTQKLNDQAAAQKEVLQGLADSLRRERAAELTGVRQIIAARDEAVLAADREFQAAVKAGANWAEAYRITNERIVEIRRNASIQIQEINKKEAEKTLQENRKKWAAEAELANDWQMALVKEYQEDLKAKQKADREQEKEDKSAFDAQQDALKGNRKLYIDDVVAAQKAEDAKTEARVKATVFALQLASDAASAGANLAKALEEQGVLSAKEAAKVQKGFAVFQAALQIPLAIATTFAQAPGESVAKGIQAAIAGAIAAVNFAAVVATPIPGFVTGGIVPELPAQPYTRNQGDNQLASVRSGEMILNRAQQARLLSLAEGRGGGAGVPDVVLNVSGRELGRVMSRTARTNRGYRRVVNNAMPVGVKR